MGTGTAVNVRGEKYLCKAWGWICIRIGILTEIGSGTGSASKQVIWIQWIGTNPDPDILLNLDPDPDPDQTFYDKKFKK